MPITKEERRHQRFERQLLTCRHYNGAIGPGMDRGHCCRAGVNYRRHVGGEDTGWVLRIPCSPKPADEDRSRVVPCALREFPTPEEVEADEIRIEARIAQTSSAIKLCREDAGGKRGIGGSIACPVCAAALHYTVAASNGHLWGRCETEGCLSWMM